MAKANAKALSHTRPAVRGARGTEVTESSKFAQGAEVARMQENKHACFLPIPVSLLCLSLHQQAAHCVGLLSEPNAEDLFITQRRKGRRERHFAQGGHGHGQKRKVRPLDIRYL